MAFNQFQLLPGFANQLFFVGTINLIAFIPKHNQAKMKKQPNKKFPAFTSLILVSILIFNGSCSKGPQSPDTGKPTTETTKIIYTDVNPGITVSYGAYDFDLNNDGIADFDLFIVSGSGRCADGLYDFLTKFSYVKVKSYGANSFGDTIPSVGGALNAIPLDSGREINQNLAAWSETNLQGWVAGYHSGGCGAPVSGHWALNTDQYLPLRLVVGSSVYFGWARISVGMPAGTGVLNFTVKGYAYNSIPGQPIFAGQTK
jgi:hypothetical protein